MTMSLPFVVTTSVEKPDLEVRKLIRSHVMLGKNLGKIMRRRPGKQKQHVDAGQRLGNIPPKVGSDLSTIRLADAVEPYKIDVILRFSSIAKQALYPLHSCILFEKKEETWIEPLAFDPAYLNAMIFTTLDYFETLRHCDQSTVSQRTLPHFLRTIQLLRRRLLQESDKALTTPTIATILALAAHAHFVGDFKSAEYHLGGLRKIVNLKGGVTTFNDNAKLLVEILRCDVGMSLNSGSRPFFFDNSSSREPFLPFPDLKLLLKSMLSSSTAEVNHNPEILLYDVDQDLAAAWIVMAEFCQVINRTAESQHRIATETFLLTMASVIYRLLDMTKFKANSTEEAIRLGLLAFSSSVFLQWKQLGLSYNYLATTYRERLAESRCQNVPPKLLLWLLVVGAVSVFGCEDEKWLRPRLRANIDSIGGLKSWTDVQDVLKSFMWIGLVLDEPGIEVFDSAMTGDSIHSATLTLEPCEI